LIRELRALLPRLLQRAGGGANGHRRTDGILLPKESFGFAGAAIDPKTMRATFGRKGQSVDLNPKEIGILHLFARRQGHLVRRSEILAHVWGPHATPTSKSLDTYLVRLRSHYRKQGIDLGRVLRSKPKVGWWVLGEKP
jgi:DNA-binding response OmpR family regulator